MSEWYDSVPKEKQREVIQKVAPDAWNRVTLECNQPSSLIKRMHPVHRKAIERELYEIHPHRGGPL